MVKLLFRVRVMVSVRVRVSWLLYFTVVERWSLTDELSLPCARPAADE